MAMVSHLAKRVRAFCSCFYSSPRYQNPQLLTSLICSSLSTQTQSQSQKELPFIAQYLISSVGFSSTRALRASAYNNLSQIKSPARPDAVVKFLSDTGLTDVQIKAAISLHPTLLAYNVDNTMKPKVRELINAGCSPELLVHLIRYNPFIILLNGAHSRFLFWRDFVGKGNEDLLKIILRNVIILALDIDTKIVPVINLLKEYGLSNPDILMLLQKGSRFIGRKPDSLRKILELIDELGIPRGSKKFPTGVKAIGGISEDTAKRKVEFFKKTYGWSQEDMNLAFTKFPSVLAYSQNKVKSNMGFLLGKAGFEPGSMVSNPRLIGLSLERVLIPRYNVLCALKAHGLKIKCSFSTAFMMSQRSFREKYVVPFEKDVPGLSQAFVVAPVVKGQDL